MITTTTLLAMAAAVLTGLSIATLLVALGRLSQRNAAVGTRLDAYLNIPLDAGAEADGESSAPQFAERLNQAIGRRGFAQRIARDLAQANLPLTVPEYVLIRAAIPLLLGLVALFIWRTVLVLPPAMLVGFAAPIFWMRMRRRRRNHDFNDLLADTLAIIASSLRGGFSLIQSIANASKESQEPMKSELRRVSQEVQLGVPIGQALDNLLARMESDDLDLVVTAIKIHGRVGGNLTTILETISATIRERARLRREIRVITSMQRMSSYVIGLLPVALALVIMAINPSYILRLFAPGWTLCIPVGAAVFSLVGFLLIQRIVDIKI